MSNTIYLQLDLAKGELYQYSKDAKDGFEEHTDKKGRTSYRKYFKDGVFGTYVGVDKRDSDIGDQVVLIMDNKDGDRYSMQWGMYDQNRNFSSYAMALLSYMPFLKEGEDYKFRPFSYENKKGKKVYGAEFLFARLEDEAIDPDNKPQRLTMEYMKDDEVVEGDIPMLEWEEDEMEKGKWVADGKKRKKYLVEVFKKHRTEGLATTSYQQKTFSKEEAKKEDSKSAAEKPNKNFDSKASTKKVETKTGPIEEDEEDDDEQLPF